MKLKGILTIAISIILLFSCVFVAFKISKSREFQFFGGLVTKVETSDKVVALTFDDGPGVNTDKILDILREEDVKATFFLIGSEIEANKAAAKKIAQAGHEIGNHSYTHKRMVLKSPNFIRNEIERTDELIREIGYEGEIQFRPPFGKRLVLLPYYLHKENRKTILWSVEPESYPKSAESSEEIVKNVLGGVEPGSIVLLHAMYENRKETLNALKEIIGSLKKQGYSFYTVNEMLKLNK